MVAAAAASCSKELKSGAGCTHTCTVHMAVHFSSWHCQDNCSFDELRAPGVQIVASLLVRVVGLGFVCGPCPSIW